ncbi:DinB family protein [Actinoalloteichus hymeniacidonis]|uniref:DinB superfamily n=1 Tax=Actinoalloteichus hymeniacidonis TaxID=340345 RepID=A0AAC9HV66_9PSEU|nr:DinB family protein [Actinoalloteichus hymeniacidonis]AOS66048.1 DinB superfamily [Actinoalloteichus hymeniacidonis]MBB5905849.1 hypothetical protein [Actinoalloteichus hymeniacidonis]
MSNTEADARPVSSSRTELLHWQFDFVWSLAEFHLAQLVTADLRWEPAENCWTMHPTADGGWKPDFAEIEPDPVPVPTIAWVTWHLGWWWSVTLDHAQGRPPRERGEIRWPGTAQGTVEWLRSLSTEWSSVLDRITEADLDAPATFPWQDNPDMTVAHTIGWVNGELMKNVAEIGQLRLLRAASAE